MDIDNKVITKSWEESLLEYLKPSDREIIMVQGAKTEEGAFQKYIEAKLGWEIVAVELDIKMKKKQAQLWAIRSSRMLSPPF